MNGQGNTIESLNSGVDMTPFAELGEKMTIPKMVEVISGVVLAGYVKENEYAERQ